MKQLSAILVLFIFSSCIPLRIAPSIKTDKVMIAKKFKRKLPKSYAFIFEDPKDADEFYYYINTKYALNHKDVEWNVPFTIENEEFFLSFYETEIPTKTLNLIPVFVDGLLDSEGVDPIFEEVHVSRSGHWYLVLTVSDSNFNDCLAPDYTYREDILKYLRALRIEYLNTHDYIQVLLKN